MWLDFASLTLHQVMNHQNHLWSGSKLEKSLFILDSVALWVSSSFLTFWVLFLHNCFKRFYSQLIAYANLPSPGLWTDAYFTLVGVPGGVARGWGLRVDWVLFMIGWSSSGKSPKELIFFFLKFLWQYLWRLGFNWELVLKILSWFLLKSVSYRFQFGGRVPLELILFKL